MDYSNRPALEAFVAERFKDENLSPELIAKMAEFLGEQQLHWWTEGKKFVSSQMRQALNI